MAMAGSSSTDSLEAVRMAVGPSAPPMTPMAAASAGVKLITPPVMGPKTRAIRNAAKMPS